MSCSDGSGGRQLRLELAVNDFEYFLSANKGLSVTTRECYVRHVLPFLTEVGDTAGVVDLGGVSAQRVRSYVTDLGGRYSPQSLRLIATAIRSFLGFAWMSGWTGCDLRPAVGGVVTHRFGRLPKALPAEDLRRLLAVPDRRTTMGSRDYALLVVLSRLGLRAGEVAGLRLDDFNWRAATVTAKVKGGRRLCLPIPHDVGQAVVAYLNRRPRRRCVPGGIPAGPRWTNADDGPSREPGGGQACGPGGVGDSAGTPAAALGCPRRSLRWRQPDRGWRTARSRQWPGDDGLCLLRPALAGSSCPPLAGGG